MIHHATAARARLARAAVPHGKGYVMTPRTKRVRSTGAEQTPAEPVTTTAALGRPDSTDTDVFDAEPVTTTMLHLHEPVTVQVDTPGPVTMTVGWLADAESKVIEPPEQSSPATAHASAETKRKTGSRRGRSGDD